MSPEEEIAQLNEALTEATDEVQSLRKQLSDRSQSDGGGIDETRARQICDEEFATLSIVGSQGIDVSGKGRQWNAVAT